jgi:hypothetical protein
LKLLWKDDRLVNRGTDGLLSTWLEPFRCEIYSTNNCLKMAQIYITLTIKYCEVKFDKCPRHEPSELSKKTICLEEQLYK